MAYNLRPRVRQSPKISRLSGEVVKKQLRCNTRSGIRKAEKARVSRQKGKSPSETVKIMASGSLLRKPSPLATAVPSSKKTPTRSPGSPAKATPAKASKSASKSTTAPLKPSILLGDQFRLPRSCLSTIKKLSTTKKVTFSTISPPIPPKKPLYHYRVYPRACFKPGLIVRAFDFTEHSGHIMNPLDRNLRTWGPTHVYGKHRPMIIVALHYGHYTALPVFSHNGNGDWLKSNEYDYIQVKDHRDEGSGYKSKSRHKPLMTGSFEKDMPLMMKESSALLTFPVCKWYGNPILKMGELDAASTRRIVRIWREWAKGKERKTK